AGFVPNCFNASGTDYAVMKYSATGQIVNAFGNNGRACAQGGANNGNDFAYAITVDGMARPILAGTFRTANDASQNAGIARFDASGAPDNTFGTSGKYTFSGNFRVAYALKIDSTGKIIVAGSNDSPFAANTSGF